MQTNIILLPSLIGKAQKMHGLPEPSAHHNLECQDFRHPPHTFCCSCSAYFLVCFELFVTPLFIVNGRALANSPAIFLHPHTAASSASFRQTFIKKRGGRGARCAGVLVPNLGPIRNAVPFPPSLEGPLWSRGGRRCSRLLPPQAHLPGCVCRLPCPPLLPLNPPHKRHP